MIARGVFLINSYRTNKHTNKLMFSDKQDKCQTGNIYQDCTNLIIDSSTINHSMHTIYDIIQYNLYVVSQFWYNFEEYCTCFGIWRKIKYIRSAGRKICKVTNENNSCIFFFTIQVALKT